MAAKGPTVEPHPLLGIAGFLLASAGVVVAIVGFALLWAILRTDLLVYSGILWAVAAALLTAGVLLLGQNLRRPRTRESPIPRAG